MERQGGEQIEGTDLGLAIANRTVDLRLGQCGVIFSDQLAIICQKFAIVGDDGILIGQALSAQHSIEGVSVMEGHVLQLQGVFAAEVKRFESTFLNHFPRLEGYVQLTYLML